MAKCEVCGNDYYLSFEVVTAGIHKLAPTCTHCGCRVIGHGVEADQAIYCCAHCAQAAGESGAVDNVASDVNSGE
jgi:Rieske Fe-S protein